MTNINDLVARTRDALEYNSIDDMRAEESDDGYSSEWLIVISSTIIEDGFTDQEEAQKVIDLIKSGIDSDILEQTNDSGSLLSADTITYCNDCQNSVHKEVNTCPECGSAKVEHITS